MGKTQIAIRSATLADLDFVMAVERQPGYPERVGTFNQEEHAHKLSHPRWSFEILLYDDRPAGFAVLGDLDNPMGNVCLHRIAVASAGQGLGSMFLAALCRHVFINCKAHRFWLDVLPDNEPAKRVYRKLGFVEEGIMRSALRYPDGQRADLLLMALLLPDWVARSGDFT
jgi:RimJ/RimL family protein N-acetyltransferase